jgi:hypothetical protein
LPTKRDCLASPTKLSTAKPSWALAADLVCEDNPPAGNLWASVSGNKRVAQQRPTVADLDGVNHLLVAGSVNWVKWEKLLQINTFDTSFHLCYLFQDNSGQINPADVPLLKIRP